MSATTTLPRLTPAQRTLFDRLARQYQRSIVNGHAVGFCSRSLRRYPPLAVLGLSVLCGVGHAGTLDRLARKGYLTVVHDDPTSPIYAVNPGAIR